MEKNKSLDNIDPQNESLHLEPIANQRKANFNKTKVADERNLENIFGCSSNKLIAPNAENWHEKRKGMSTVKQNKRKKLKLKEKPEMKPPTYKQEQDEDSRNSPSLALNPCHGRGSMMSKKQNHIFRSPNIKNDDFFTFKQNQNEFQEEAKGDKYFPELFEADKHEEAPNQIIDSVPHKLPDLSSKYRKFLKDSSSDEFEPKNKPEPNMDYDFDQKLYLLKEAEVTNTNKLYPEEAISKLANDYKTEGMESLQNNNRSRSMLNRLNQNNTESKKNSSNNPFSNTLPKNARVAKDDTSSHSPSRMLNISGNATKKTKKKIISKHKIILKGLKKKLNMG